MTPRFETHPHQANREYPHDGGWARWDVLEKRQVGWFRQQDACEARCRQLATVQRTAGSVTT